VKTIVKILVGVALVAMFLLHAQDVSALNRSRQNLRALAGQHAAVLVELQKTKNERNQFAAAFLQSLESEARCEQHFQETFSRRNYASAE
jgi:hypothetical protein